MKKAFLSLSARPARALFKTAIVTLLVLAFAGCRQNNKPDVIPPVKDSLQLAPTDSVADEDVAAQTEESPATLSFQVMKQAVSPEQKYDEKGIEELFASMQLPKIQAERYISDADWGGNSPAISYVWGNEVEFKNWKLVSTAPDYFGTHFNFFFDKTRKTGRVKTFAIITSFDDWYQQFMADAKKAGMTFSGNLDKAVYLKEGKEYVLKTGEETYYYINDFSANGKYDVEFGYETGVDM